MENKENQQQNQIPQPNNKSKAEQFVFKGDVKLLQNADFLANINTSAQSEKPHYSLCKFVSHLDIRKSIYLGLKTMDSIAILEYNRQDNKLELKKTLDFGKMFVNKHRISYFDFVQSTISSDQDNQILIGFRSGLILLKDFMTSKFIENFNQLDDKETPWKKQQVTKLCIIPFKQQFLALFLDSSVVKYSLRSSQACNTQFLQEVDKLNEKFPLEKQFSKFTPERKKVEQIYEIASLAGPHEQFQCLGMYSLDDYKQPSAYFKFSCSHITDLLVFLPEHYISSLVVGEDAPYEPLVVAYSGSDGFLRILDIQNLTPIFLFKSNYGGIQAITLDNNKNSPLIALACQDDTTVVINLQTNNYLRIQGHSSFISKTVFLKLNENTTRIINSSFDGYLSYIEILNETLNNENKIEENSNNNKQKVIKVSRKIPIIINYEHTKSKQIFLKDKVLVNEEGIGYMNIFGNLLITSSFDGCCSVWALSNLEDKNLQEDENKKNDNNSNKKTSYRRNKQ